MQAIHVAAKLGLADLVATGPKTVVELSEATRMNGTSLARFLRALTSSGSLPRIPPADIARLR